MKVEKSAGWAMERGLYAAYRRPRCRTSFSDIVSVMGAGAPGVEMIMKVRNAIMTWIKAVELLRKNSDTFKQGIDAFEALAHLDKAI
mgnify:CR=1 FL=1